jgi:hypothetical protein
MRQPLRWHISPDARGSPLCACRSCPGKSIRQLNPRQKRAGFGQGDRGYWNDRGRKLW